jgi:cytochrome c-type biogenesis protein CcmF
MSVGRPYFDSMVVPIGATLLFLLGIGPALPWGRATAAQVRHALLPPLAGAAILVIAGYLLGVRNVWTLLTLAFGGYAAQVTFAQMRSPITQLRRGARRLASYVVHAGVVVAVIAIAVSSTMRTQAELSLTKGGSATVAGYTVTLLGIEERAEPHRQSTMARFAVVKNGVQKMILEPRMNQYMSMREPIGSPDVYTTATGDLYLSLMNVDSAQQSASMHVIYTPMVVWIWIAVLLMGVGGLMSVIPAALTRPSATLSRERERALVGAELA